MTGNPIIGKELITPSHVDRKLYVLAPIMVALFMAADRLFKSGNKWLLLRYYADVFVDVERLPFRRFSIAAQNRLRNYPWPGNVRELKSIVKRLLILGGDEEISLREVEAQLAADMRYPIVTISLGNAADTDLMQQIADMTGGVHFNVPGGGTVTDYRDNLMQVFRQIADDRPLVLVK